MSEPLSMVQMQVDSKRLMAFAAARRLMDDDLGYALHAALRERFGEIAPQPLRILDERGGAKLGPTLTVLGYSSCGDAFAKASREDDSAVSIPDWSADWRSEPCRHLLREPARLRAMPSCWKAGDTFGFDVLVRPVRRASAGVRKDQTGAPARGGERDAFLSVVGRVDEDEVVLRERVYRDWLGERFGGGATVRGEARLVRFRRTRVCRSAHAKGGVRRFEGPEALMSGSLIVEDPESFDRLLRRGVGRHAAFGYGMLLLRPAGRD